ncbi:NADP-dependent oxidoreductase [Nocardia yamanashiensis]|uniref:NADP-dependent oxidoreductase n=1 Tax=Nocardia yamanashiensis TaxID=209247 RepID=UPI001E5403D0|nr:NADP-dependent oxidoreductase [Nocardia yamanashiensis]UGT43064.1 NADP-dependent oxidoreductase [Nocardia yamanashiensis]
MRAVIVRTFGGPEVLEIAELPVPDPGPGQLRIRVTAATVNPVDLHTRSGGLTAAGLLPAREVIGIGWDVAGVVDAIGPEPASGTGFAVGDAVIGLSDRLDVPLGAQADFVVLDAVAVARAPRSITAQQAATIPLNALTAAQSLDLLALGPGQSVLVTGAAGAVGGFAVELAKARGLRVVATAGAADAESVRSLGAEFFVPLGARLGEAVRALVPGGVDGAVDAAVLGAEALDAVRNRGAFAAVVGGAEPVGLRGIRVANTWIRADAAQLADLVHLVDTGALTPRVADILPLARVADAHKRLAEGGVRGRIVLVP